MTLRSVVSRGVPFALTLVSAAVVTSTIGTVIQEQSWFLHVWGFAFATTAAAEVARMLRARYAVSVLVALATLILLTHATLAGNDARGGWWPTWNSWSTIAQRMSQGADVIASSVPPAPAVPALIDLVSLCVALVALVLHRFIVIKESPLLAGLVLASSAIVPIAVLDDGAPLSTFVLIGATFLTLLTAHQQRTARRWGKVISAHGTPALRINGGLRLGALALAVGLVTPLVIPGLDEPVWRPGSGGVGGSGTSVASSLLLDPEVSLRRQLTRADDIEVLRYRTSDDSPNYMRIGALTEFDGTVWRRKSFIPLNTDVNADNSVLLGISPTTKQSTYSVAVKALDNRLLPVPYPALSIDGITGRWAVDALTLTVFSDQSVAAGQRYSVTAFDVSPNAAQLRTITSDQMTNSTPLGSPRDWLAYPADLDPEFLSITDEVIADQERPYDQALAIQNWFRNSFTYSLTTSSDPELSPLMSFLNDRTGYCEQFAGAMALMARIAGIPSRVAIGFTSGTKSSTGDWVVTAHDAHAWPELWFPGQGWVRFEPTPRADIASGVAVPAWAPAPNEGTADVDRRGEQSGDGTQTQDQVPSGAEDPASEQGAGAGITVNTGRTELWRWLILTVVGVASIAALFIPAVVRKVRIQRRVAVMRRELDAGLDAAWDELRDVFVDTSAPWHESMTPRQSLTALSSRITDEKSRQAFADIVKTTERVRYANVPVLPLAEIDLEGQVRTVSRALRKPLTRAHRVRLWLMPASVIRRRTSGRDGAGTAPQP